MKPRLGFDINGEEIVVKCRDDAHLQEVSSGWTKGQAVTLQVEVRPPYGSRGDVDYVLPGVIESRETWR